MATPSSKNPTQPAPGVNPGSQARQPHTRQIPRGSSLASETTSGGVSLEDVRAWIKQNQTLAVAGAFVVGLFIGVSARD